MERWTIRNNDARQNNTAESWSAATQLCNDGHASLCMNLPTAPRQFLQCQKCSISTLINISCINSTMQKRFGASAGTGTDTRDASQWSKDGSTEGLIKIYMSRLSTLTESSRWQNGHIYRIDCSKHTQGHIGNNNMG